jgi:EAL domain-containing protein (putative c-di-GMP-specific phosphodiesterase class I)
MKPRAPSSREPLLHDELRSIQDRRISLMLLAIGVMLTLISLGWCVFFLRMGLWVVAGIDLALAAVGLVVIWLVRRERPRQAAFLLLPVLFVNFVLMAAVFDIPTAEVPRSAHIYLLALAIASYMVLQHERPWLRHTAPLLCMLIFVFLASSNEGIETPYAMPDSVRAGGTWVNNILALVCIAVLQVIVQADVTLRTSLETDLQQALLEHQFLLHYQPQVDQNGRVTGAEALVRWQHPVRGMVPPGAFIGLAEQNGQILPLGQWVLETACHQLRHWAEHPAMAGITLSVNVSAHQFRQANFVEQVLATLQRTGIDARRLKLELTESMLVNDLGDIITKMEQLKERGVGFSLDDFGTGYSSLSYLRRLPLDQLKIDQSFVRDVLSDPNAAAIARTVIALGQSLNLAVIAEGVETQGQRDFLSQGGCHAFQGYLFSRPLPIMEFDALVTSAGFVLPPAASAGEPTEVGNATE